MKSLSLRSIVATLALLVAVAPASVRAAATSSSTPAAERFLFVVDKSSDMEKLQDATEATIFDLVGSGLYGQMRPGDTFGMWTFNKEVSTGKFSMQIWDQRRARQQATMMAAFLSGVEYEGSSSTKDLTDKIKSIVHAVSNVTVFIISDGDATMKGTPFDKTINAEYKRQRKQRASAKRPFVTTLIARDGWIIDQSVTVAGTRIDLPPRATQPQPETPALVNEPKTSTAVSSPVVQATPAPKPKITIITKRPAETNAPAETKTTETSPALATAKPVESPAPTAPAPQPVPAAAAERAAPTRTFEVASQDSILAAAHTAKDNSESQPAATPTSTAIPTLPATTAASQQTTPASHAAPAATPVPSSTIETVLARIAPEATPVAARETTPASSTTDSTSGIGTIQGAATPVVHSTNPMILIGFGATMLIAALALGVMVLRQRRTVAGASLITQSMDRQ